MPRLKLPGLRSTIVLFQEIIRSAVAVLEIWGAQQTLQRIPGLGRFDPAVRILAVGLGKRMERGGMGLSAFVPQRH